VVRQKAERNPETPPSSSFAQKKKNISRNSTTAVEFVLRSLSSKSSTFLDPADGDTVAELNAQKSYRFTRSRWGEKYGIICRRRHLVGIVCCSSVTMPVKCRPRDISPAEIRCHETFANVFVSSWLGSCSSHLPA